MIIQGFDVNYVLQLYYVHNYIHRKKENQKWFNCKGVWHFKHFNIDESNQFSAALNYDGTRRIHIFRF